MSIGAMFFFMEEFSSTLSALPCQAPFCQTAPLLPSVAQQQNVTGVGKFSLYCHTTNIPSDAVGQHTKIGGITFRAALTYWKREGPVCMHVCLSGEGKTSNHTFLCFSVFFNITRLCYLACTGCCICFHKHMFVSARELRLASCAFLETMYSWWQW